MTTSKRRAFGAALFILSLVSTLKMLHLQAAPQRTEQRQRINKPLDDRRAVRLPQTTHLRTRQARDTGRVAADLPMERVVLTLKSAPEQEAELEDFLTQQQDASSPHFH